MEKWPFFRAAAAGLGTFCMGVMAGLGSIGLKLSLRYLPPKQAKASSTAMMTAVHCL